jgi:hypothetical protein
VTVRAVCAVCVAVTGRVENGTIESEPLFTRRDGELVRDHGMPARHEAFETAGIDLDDVLGHAVLSPGPVQWEP